MEEQRQNLHDDAEGAAVDPEQTLVAPRFDAREVVTAQPVVPLADAPHARRAGRQGTLPLVLILVSALVGGLVSVLGYRFYQQRTQQSPAQQPAAEQQAAPSPEIPAVTTTSETPATTPEMIAEPQPAPVEEVAEVREAVASEEGAEREEEREDRAGRDPEATGESREERPAARAAATRRPAARRVEEITTPTTDLRIRRGRYDGQEATDYEVPARPRANRRAQRRARERNIDRVRAIFEGQPPTQ